MEKYLSDSDELLSNIGDNWELRDDDETIDARESTQFVKERLKYILPKCVSLEEFTNLQFEDSFWEPYKDFEFWKDTSLFPRDDYDDDDDDDDDDDAPFFDAHQQEARKKMHCCHKCHGKTKKGKQPNIS